MSDEIKLYKQDWLYLAQRRQKQAMAAAEEAQTTASMAELQSHSSQAAQRSKRLMGEATCMVEKAGQTPLEPLL